MDSSDGPHPDRHVFLYFRGTRLFVRAQLGVLEMAHEARVIPTGGRPPLDPSIRRWMGESRGHWEGNRLVVETTNFNGRTDMTNAGVPGSPPINPTTNMRITERFSRTAEDTIDFEMRVEDPDVIVSPWAVAFPLKLDNKYQTLEYACHGGNTALRARASEIEVGGSREAAVNFYKT